MPRPTVTNRARNQSLVVPGHGRPFTAQAREEKPKHICRGCVRILNQREIKRGEVLCRRCRWEVAS